jgi:hypothetical protein
MIIRVIGRAIEGTVTKTLTKTKMMKTGETPFSPEASGFPRGKRNREWLSPLYFDCAQYRLGREAGGGLLLPLGARGLT